MTKTKSTKRALLSAILALVMTVSMLVGTTFAWFTDSVTSAGNKIVAGNLDVELHLFNGSKYVDISDANQPIFGANGLAAAADSSSTLWEPGKTQVAYLAIKNDGSLALKYKVALTVTNITKNLNDVVTYTITPDAKGDAPLTAWDGTDAKKVVAGEQVVSGTADNAYVFLGAGETHYFALSVHMDELADNKYMGGEISFDLTVLATQVESETDSFGDDYDGGLGDYELNLGGGVTEKGMIQQSEDGSKVFYSEETDRVQLMALPENVGTEYSVPNGITHLGSAINNNDTVEKLTIPTTVTNAYKAFEYNTSVKEVILEEGMTTIPNRTFYKASVESVVIPESVTTIEENAFAQAKLDSLTVPANIETIKQQAFAYMPNLKSVVIESGADIPYYAFRGCPELKVVIIEGDNDIYLSEQTFSNREAGGRHNMQFYVTSQAMADKITAACGAQRPYADDANYNVYTVNVVTEISDGFYKGAPDAYGNERIYYGVSGESVAAFSEWRAGAPGLEYGPISAYFTLLGDVDMAGINYTPFNGTFTQFDGNGFTISNLKAGQGVSGKSGLVSYLGGGIIKNLTLENASANGCQAGLFAGQCEGGKIENCFIAGKDNKVTWSQNTTSSYDEQYCGIGAVVGWNNVGSFEVTILDGAVVKLVDDGMTTLGTKVDSFIGGGAANGNASGVVNNGIADTALVSAPSTNEAFKDALASSDIVDVTLPDGTFTLPSPDNRDEQKIINISGTKDTVVDITLGSYMEKANITFEGVTIKGGLGMAGGNGADYAALYSENVTYIDCHFDGGFRVGRDGATFIGCTFDLTTTSSTGMEYVWTYGNDVTFDKCIFNTSGKAILVYSDGGNEVAKVTVKNCTFNSDMGAKAGAIANQNCAAIEIDNFGNGVDLVTSGNKVDTEFSGEWRIKSMNPAKPAVIVNGTQYTTLALDGKKMTIDASKNVTVEA